MLKTVRGERRPRTREWLSPGRGDAHGCPARREWPAQGDTRMGAMADQEELTRGFVLNTGPLLAGAVLIGIGSLLGLAGLAIAGATLTAAARRYVNNMEVPPGQLAKQNLAKARAAASAGASAWRDGAAQPAISDQ